MCDRANTILNSLEVPQNLATLISKYDYYTHITSLNIDYKGVIKEIKELSNGTLVTNYWDERTFTITQDESIICTIKDEEGEQKYPVVNIEVLKDDTIITYSCDYTKSILKVWKLVDGVYKQYIEKNIQGMPCIDILHGELLVIGSSHGRLIIWDPKGSEIQLYEDPTSIVRVIPFGKEYRILSGDENGIIKVWNPVTFENEQTFKITQDGYVEVYHIVSFSNNRIIIIYNNDMFAIWNWLTETLLFKGKCCEDDETIESSIPGAVVNNTINCVIIFTDKEWIVTGSEKGILKIWDPTNMKIYKCITFSSSIKKLMVLPNNHIMVDLEKGEIAFFDMEKNSITYAHNNNGSVLLVTKDGNIISASTNSTV